MSDRRRNNGTTTKNNNHKNSTNTKPTASVVRFITDQPWYYRESKVETDHNNTDLLLHHRSTNSKDQVLKISSQRNDKAHMGYGIKDEFIPLSTTTTRNTNKRNRNLIRCDTCGAVGHLRKDCLDIPLSKRKKKKIDDNNNLKNAVLASKQIDEKSLNILVRNDNNYDSKRDRWFGYKGKDYAKVLERYTQNLNTENNSDVGTDLDTDEECELMLLGLTPQDISIYLQNKDKNQDDNKTYTSVRLREDKAVYLTIGEDGEEGVTKYDPKSRLYKDETKGVINTKNNFYYRNVDGEGLEFTKLQNKLKLIQQEEGTANTSGTAPNGDTRWKNNRRKNFDHNIQEKVLIANPTKYEYLLSKKNKDDDKKQKRDLKYYEAVRPTSEPNGSDQKQLIDKVIDKYK